jgi:adenylate kinase
MILLMMGPPGSGKGTQARRVAERFHLKHFTTGDMLREEIANHTAIGEQVQAAMDAGKFAPDHIVQHLVRDRLAKSHGNVLFDGYPRNLGQVEDLDEMLGDLGEKVDAIVVLDVPEGVLAQRIADRARAQGRPDDRADAFPQRWLEYTTKTLPAIDRYRGHPNFFRVDGTQTIETVFAEICKALDSAVAKQHSGL